MSRIQKICSVLCAVVFCLAIIWYSSKDQALVPTDPPTQNLEKRAPQEQRKGTVESEVLDNAFVPISTRESVSPYHFREVSIERFPGAGYPVRKEAILHVDASGDATTKSSVSYAASHVIVSLEGDEIPAQLSSLGEWTLIQSAPESTTYLLLLKDWHIDSVPYLLERLGEEPYASYVRYAEPDYVVSAYLEPNDPEYQNGNQWGLDSDVFIAGINAAPGWEIRSDAPDVVVAVIDSGVDLDHPDLHDNLWRNPNEFPENGIDDDGNGLVDDWFGANTITDTGDVEDGTGHGTHVAGIIGAVGNNETGIAGVAWSTQLMTVKFLNEFGFGFVSDAIESIHYSVDHGADIINASWGSFEYSQGLYDAVEYAAANDVLFVAASGNSSKNLDVFPDYPSSFDSSSLVSVGSVQIGKLLSDFSNWGKFSVDIAAPGSDIMSTIPVGAESYLRLSGTSMAAPHVAGVLALQVQQFNEDNADLQIARLLQNFRPLEKLDTLVSYAGIPDLEASLRAEDPILDFRFKQRLPQQFVRFRGQSLELVADLENGDGASYSWIRNNHYEVSGGQNRTLNLDDLTSYDSDPYKVVVKKDGLMISDATRLYVIDPNLVLRAASESQLDVGTQTRSSWLVATDTSAVGPSSVVVGATEANSSRSLYSHVEGEGVLSFYWKVSSEEDYDFLNFKVNGELVERISGEKNWEKMDVQLSGEGLKILEWEYLKDEAVTEHSDNAHVDGIEWFPAGFSRPLIQEEPRMQTLSMGSTALFEVIAVGENLQYQWFKDGVQLEGAEGAILEIQNVAEEDGGFYRVEVSNQFGFVKSRPAQLRVGDYPAEIIIQPSSLRVREGVSASFEIQAAGTEPLFFQWYKDGVAIVGEDTSSLVFPEVSAIDEGSFHVEVWNAFSDEPLSSAVVSLELESNFTAPSIIKQTADFFVPAGRPARLDVVAVGSFPLYYQWYHNDVLLENETAASLLIPQVDGTHVGDYYCEVWNEFGATRSDSILVSVIDNIGNAIEAPLLEWETNHPEQVISITDPTHDGEDAIKISAGLDGSPTYIKTTVEGPARITFRHMNDFISVAGDMQLSINGIPRNLPTWTYGFFGEEVIELSAPGEHEILILVSGSILNASLMVDQFEVINQPLLSFDTTRVGLPLGADYTIPLTILSKEPYSIEWYKDGEQLPNESQPHLHLAQTEAADGGAYYAVVTNEFGSSRSEDFEVSMITETAGATLDVDGLVFSYEGEGFWFPQDDRVWFGETALESPEFQSEPSTIYTFVQGPLSGTFRTTWGVWFMIDGEHAHLGDISGEEFDWDFQLPEDKLYKLEWINTEYAGVGYVDHLRLFPLFRFEKNIGGPISLFQGDEVNLEVRVPRNGFTQYQWFKNVDAMEGETSNSIGLSYDEVATGDRIYVRAFRGGRFITSGEVAITKAEGPNGPEIQPFEYEGLTFYTQGDDLWEDSGRAFTATDGRSLYAGEVAEDFEGYHWSSWLYFLAEGPGILNYRAYNRSLFGSLRVFEGEIVEYHPDEVVYYTDPNWKNGIHRFRNPGVTRLNFQAYKRGPETPEEILIFLEEFEFRRAPILASEPADVHLSVGSAFHYRIDPVAVAGPVSIRWLRDGEHIAEWDDLTEVSIAAISHSDGGTYTVELSEPGDLYSTENFEVFTLEPLASVLNSSYENYVVSYGDDWEVIDLESGETTLAGDVPEWPPDMQRPNPENRISIATTTTDAGMLRLRMKVDRYFELERSNSYVFLRVDGEEIWRYKFETLDWVEHEIEFPELGSRQVELSFDAANYNSQPSSLYLDEFSFTSDVLVSHAPKSKLVYLGEPVSYNVLEGLVTEEELRFVWWKGDEMVEENLSGIFSIPLVEPDDYGEYSLQVLSGSKVLNEYLFQLVDASILNDALDVPSLTFSGEYFGMVEWAKASTSDRAEFLSIENLRTDESASGSFSAVLQAPFALQMDTSYTGADADESLKLAISSQEVWSLSSSEWETVENHASERGNLRVDWVFNLRPNEGSESVLIDQLQIDNRPMILAQSESTHLVGGSPLLLSADVLATESTEFQWFKDGELLVGQRRPYLVVAATGTTESGDYHLIASNEMGEGVSEPIQLEVQDDFGRAFPFQAWNWRTINREYLSVDEGTVYGGEPTLRVEPPLNGDVKPGLKFRILGPRVIDLMSFLPQTQGNSFVLKSQEWETKSGNLSSVAWGRSSLTVYGFGVKEITLEFDNYASPSFPNDFDGSPGWVGSIEARWPEGSSIARWIEWALPYTGDTMTDFELIFGDADGDGVQNIIEYATLSSAVVPGSNIWVVRGPDGRDESIHFYRPFDVGGPFGFQYALEASPDLINWERIPFIFEPDDFSDDSYKVYSRIRPDPSVDLPEDRCFLRLAVSTDFYLAQPVDN